MHTIPPHNRRVADRLREASALLHVQGASPYRANAYRHAAESIARMPRDVLDIYAAEGVKGLDAIPHVGLGIAAAVAEMLTSGRWAQLDRLRGSIDPATLFRSVPGMGPELAKRIHEQLHIDSLEALEAAANDGRLDGVPGIGERRIAAWRAYLAEALGRGGARPPEHEVRDEKVLHTERYYGRQFRSFTLGRDIDRKKVEAKFTDGVLELTLPKNGAAPGEKIAIQ